MAEDGTKGERVLKLGEALFEGLYIGIISTFLIFFIGSWVIISTVTIHYMVYVLDVSDYLISLVGVLLFGGTLKLLIAGGVMAIIRLAYMNIKKKRVGGEPIDG